MPSLDNLKKRLYQPDADKDLSERLQYKFDQNQEPEPPKKPFLSPKVKKWLKYGLMAGGAVILVSAGIVFLTRKTSFNQAKVKVEIDGPQKIESGEFLKYDFVVKNDNPISLEHVKLIIDYPEGSRLQNPDIGEIQDEIHIGRLGGNEKQTVSSYVKVFGPEGEKYVVDYKLSYLPSRLSTSLEKKDSFAIDIVSSPLKLVIDEPKIITLGKDITYTINLSNDSANSFKDVQLKLTYPPGFSVSSFSPNKPDIGNHTWKIDQLNPREQKEFYITGKLNQELEVINLEAAAQLKNEQGGYQTYSQAYSAASLTPAPIKVDVQPVNLTIPNIINPGTELSFIVNFQNTTDSVLRDINLSLKLDGEFFDMSSVYPEDKGIYTKETGEISWDGRRIPQLAILNPFEAGSTKVDLRIKPALPLVNYSDKNFTGTATARVRVNNVPPELSGIQLEDSSQTSLKLNSVLTLRGEVLSTSSQFPVDVTGPRPPKVGRKTEYLVAWQILNRYNDLSNVSVKSYLPQGVDWEESWWPTNSNVTFDPLTGEVLWQLDEIKAGTGFTSPVKQLIFKVSTIPSPSQAGGNVVLVGEATARAKDTFTNQNLNSSTRQLDTPSRVNK